MEALRSQQHDAVLLEHRSWRVDLREWMWGLRPVSPEFIPPLDFFRYAGKEWGFFHAAARLPRSRPFRLEQPATMEEFDVVLVGSDEVWSPKHAWYGDCPIFYGAGVLGPCLQFPVDPDPVPRIPNGPCVALYGYRFGTPSHSSARCSRCGRSRCRN